jgi:hypothetical protein
MDRVINMVCSARKFKLEFFFCSPAEKFRLEFPSL